MIAVLLLLAAAEAPPEDQIRGWIEQLASEQWRVREEATQRLIEAGEPAGIPHDLPRRSPCGIPMPAASPPPPELDRSFGPGEAGAMGIPRSDPENGPRGIPSDPAPTVGLPEIDTLRGLSDAGLEMLYAGRYAGSGGQASEISGSLIVVDGDLGNSYIEGSVVIVTGTLQCDYVANSLLLVGGDTRVDTMSGSILLGREEATVSSADSSVLAGGLRVDVLENCVTIEREAPATSYSFESRHVDEASVLEWLERFQDR